MFTSVGSCPKCGAPVYCPTVWHGITPPPSTPSCGCGLGGNPMSHSIAGSPAFYGFRPGHDPAAFYSPPPDPAREAIDESMLKLIDTFREQFQKDGGEKADLKAEIARLKELVAHLGETLARVTPVTGILESCRTDRGIPATPEVTPEVTPEDDTPGPQPSF